jgi:hypothetical protein
MPDFRLRILGPVLSADGTEIHELTGRDAAAAAFLANPPGERRHASVLSGALWPGGARSPNNLQTVISHLRAAALPVTTRNGFYRLDLALEQVDATYFIAQAQDRDALAKDPARLDALLGLWTADPSAVHERYLSNEVWKPLRRAWRDVVDIVRDADSDYRDGLTNVAPFRQLFPGEPLMKELLPRKRLLIVDDEHAEYISTFLGPRYEYKRITSEKEWYQLIADGPLEFDGAIVDRCLFKGSDDQAGLAILEYLHKHYRDAIPRILISAQLGGRQLSLVKRYGLFEAFGKLQGERLTGLSDAVEQMLDRAVER